MTEPALVADPKDVTEAWLTDALHAAGLGSDGRVAGFDCTPVGTGQMARNFRFSLRWSDGTADGPASVVGKFPSDDPTSRATGAAQGGYGKEVGFYREIVDTVEIRTPRCHFARIDERGADFVLLMEDVAPAEQGDQIAGCSVDEAALALRELAKLHAPRWGDASLAKHDFLGGPSPQAGQLLQGIYSALFPGFRDRYAERLSSDAIELAERLGPRLEAWSGQAGDRPLTVAHGDYRLDNLLFGRGDDAPPIAVVDWQTVTRGIGTGDAAYFLGAGLAVEDRRAHEASLLRDYHDALVAGGVADYDWEACWRDYRLTTFGGVVMAVVASMIVERTDRGDDMFVAMASRHAQHALDVEAESLID